MNTERERKMDKQQVLNINTIISNDIQKVWNIVLAVDKYNSWRSDLSKTEIINDKQFIEYTKNVYRRLSLYYGDRMTFDIESVVGRGTICRICIPL